MLVSVVVFSWVHGMRAYIMVANAIHHGSCDLQGLFLLGVMAVLRRPLNDKAQRCHSLGLQIAQSRS